MQNEYSIEINATPEQVFYWLDEPDRVMQWMSNVVENENLEVTEKKVGSTFRQVYVEGGRRMELQGVVTEYVANERLKVRIAAKGFELEADYLLAALNGGTRLTQISDVRFKGFMKLLGWLMVLFMKNKGQKQLEEDFAKLKSLCESAGPN